MVPITKLTELARLAKADPILSAHLAKFYAQDQDRDDQGRFSGPEDALNLQDWFFPNSNPGLGDDYEQLRNPTTPAGRRFTKYLRTLPLHQGTTYRGLVVPPADAGSFTTNTYVERLHSSSSSDEVVARDFLAQEATAQPGGQPILLQLEGPTRDLQAALPTELATTRELVVEAGTRYAFAGLFREPHDVLRIKLRALQPSKPISTTDPLASGP